MAAPMGSTTVGAEDVLGILQRLTPELRQQVFDFAEFLVQRQHKSMIVVKPPVFLDFILGKFG